MFGYNDLIVDPRNFVFMRDAGCPVTADITHALQQPAGRALEVSPQLYPNPQSNPLPALRPGSDPNPSSQPTPTPTFPCHFAGRGFTLSVWAGGGGHTCFWGKAASPKRPAHSKSRGPPVPVSPCALSGRRRGQRRPARAHPRRRPHRGGLRRGRDLHGGARRPKDVARRRAYPVAPQVRRAGSGKRRVRQKALFVSFVTKYG
jgi:hypothetical protein